jgi:hypothetical protein
MRNKFKIAMTRVSSLHFEGLITSVAEKTTSHGKNLVEFTLTDPPSDNDSDVSIKLTVWGSSNHAFSFIISDLPGSIRDLITKGVQESDPMMIFIGEAKKKPAGAGAGHMAEIQLWGHRDKVNFKQYEAYIMEQLV